MDMTHMLGVLGNKSLNIIYSYKMSHTRLKSSFILATYAEIDLNETRQIDLNHTRQIDLN